jgi:uncharacterized delta-60 repeat protein
MKTTSKARNKAALLFFSVALLLAGGAATVRAQSALDGFDPNANGAIRAVVVQPDGKILIGGEFTALSPNGGAAVTRNNIARLNPDGTLDLNFNPNANGPVNAIAVQADGNILVGGAFSQSNGTPTIGGQTRNHIARLDPATGTADPSFDPNANLDVYAIAVQADGKILVGGDFTDFGNGTPTIGGKIRNSIARLDPTTGAADSFDPNANNRVRAIVVQADGKILVGGDFSFATPTIGGQPRNFIARLDSTTGLADSFDPNATSTVRAIAVQADGKILAGGVFTGIGGAGRNEIARLDGATGAADLSFDPNANSNVDSIAVQPDGKILLGGDFTALKPPGSLAIPRNRIARLDPNTGAPDSFDPNASATVNAVAVQVDGKVLAVGLFTTIAPNGGAAVTGNRIARLETDGRLDQTLDASLSIDSNQLNTVYATSVQPDGKILIGGHFSSVLGVPRNNIARLNTDGTLDMTFDPNANSNVFSIAVQADGKILVGGDFFSSGGGNSIGGQPRNNIARLDPTGKADPLFDPNANFSVGAIAVQTDRKILVGGRFSTLQPDGASSATPRNNIARLNTDGTLDTGFDPNANEIVEAIVVQADGKILAGGQFTRIGGQTRNGIARLDPTTGAADSFDPNANAQVISIAVQADGNILVGGAFNGPIGTSTIGGATRNYIARLDATTGLADAFDPNANSDVFSIAVQADGQILAGGIFSTQFGAPNIGGQARNYIARLDSTGKADPLFNPNANGGVNAIAMQADGKILAGGAFNGANSIGGQSRNYFARLTNDTAALQNLAVTEPSAISWGLGGASPHFTRVTFESSTDNVNYTPLGSGTAFGSGTASGNNWILTGLNLPAGQNIYIRARGYYRGGQGNGSESVTESVRNAFFVVTGISGTASSATTVGGTISDTATLSGGVSPTGLITFKVYGPNDSTCGGPVAFSSSSKVNRDGTYNSAAFTPTAAGTYRFVVSYTGDAHNASFATACGDASETVAVNPASTPTPTPTPTPTTGLVGNVSTRLPVGTDDNVLIEGFIVQGPAGSAKKIIVRAIGPSLAPFGITDALANPTLEIHDANNANAIVASNDDWGITQLGGLITADQSAEIAASGFAPGNDLESAIIANLAPGSYTAVVRGLGNTVGTGVVDAFDLSAASPARLANIATRGLIQPGDKLMIAGFIIQNGPVRAVVRAIGPSLSAFGITNALADTTLQLRDGNGAIVVENDDWKVRTDGSSQQAELEATGLQPTNDLEAAFVTTLQPGQYTAQVRGKPETTGIGVVQVYFLQ